MLACKKAEQKANSGAAQETQQRLVTVEEDEAYQGFASRQDADDQEYRKAWIANEHAALQQQTTEFQRVVNDATIVEAKRSEAMARQADEKARKLEAERFRQAEEARIAEEARKAEEARLAEVDRKRQERRRENPSKSFDAIQPRWSRKDCS